MSRIDAIGGSSYARRAQRSAPEASDNNVIEITPSALPVPVGRVRRIEPRAGRGQAEAGFAAQLIGQEGATRGLRGGPETLERARRAYERTEWSGGKDRRAPKGGQTNQDI